jgi:hypothetical protein
MEAYAGASSVLSRSSPIGAFGRGGLGCSFRRSLVWLLAMFVSSLFSCLDGVGRWLSSASSSLNQKFLSSRYQQWVLF